jgi:hypothetical protein
MRRKLIKQETFEQIANSSVVMVENELVEAERILSRALGQNVTLHSFNESTVLYETADETYVHAGYKFGDNKITFNNIEELVIDEESKAARRRSVLSEMLDSVIKEKSEKAKSLFQDYMGLSTFTEAKKFVIKTKEKEGNPDFEAEERDDKKKKVNQLPDKKSPFEKIDDKKKKDKKDKDKEGGKGLNFEKGKDAFKKKLKSAGKKIEEAYMVAENVLDYVEYMNIGPVLEESVQQHDKNGDLTDIQIPSSRVRNEGKILNFDWKVLNHKCKVLRSGAKSLCEDQDFVRSIADLKIQNNVSNSHGLEEALDAIAVKWPNVLYLTQDELSNIVGEALQIAGERNFDDRTCNFMAEGILRRIHESYKDKVNQILHLANAPKNEGSVDAYDYFKGVVEDFFPYVDHKTGVELKVFEDLYDTLSEIYNTAKRRGHESLKSETAGMLNDIADVLNDEVRPDLELAEEVAQWLTRFIESNVQGASDSWNVSNMPHHTVNGDHPQMSRNARVPAIAATHNGEGDWGDSAPMIGQDNMSYKGGHASQARSSSWGNIGGSDTFPTLSNPYIPKPFGDYTMKGEKGVDKDALGQHHSTWQSGDTWPALHNPYVPKEVGNTGGQGYKMKNGSETDLVVDKGVNTR